MADIIFNKKTGQIKAIFKTHGVKQNVSKGNGFVALEIPKDHLMVMQDFYVKGRKLVKKEGDLSNVDEIEVVYYELKEPVDPIIEQVVNMTKKSLNLDWKSKETPPEEKRMILPVKNGKLDITQLPENCTYSISHPHYKGKNKLKGAPWRPRPTM